MEKLNKLFGIKIARVDGGGATWGSFLKAALIDEISSVILPVADGAMGTPTMFDIEKGKTDRKGKALKLKSIKKLENDTIWMRWLVNN